MKDYGLMENLEIDFENIYSEIAILLREEVVLEDADLDEARYWIY